MSQLHTWLHSRLQNQANSYWSLCYRASSHGWSGWTFHSYCDNRGPTVTIIRAHSYIFGGYTDQSWRCKFINCHHFCKKKQTKNQSNQQKNKKKSTIKSSQIHILKWQKLKILSLWNGRSFKIIFALGSCCQSLITRGRVSTGYPHAFECNLVWIGRSKFSEQTKLHESERRQKSKQVKFWQHALSYFTQFI